MNPDAGPAGKVVIRPLDEVEAVPMAKGRGAAMQVVLGPAEGVPNFILRRFTLEPGAYVPRHRHDVLEHEQVVLEGEMVLLLEREERIVRAGDAVFLPAGTAHAYENRGTVPVRFLCIVPARDPKTEWLE
ncbi:MAG: cupin domain-containing protein [Planctomycetota bacterium]|jgi:quercetin dioxygenase-like cupin family protein